MKNGLEVIDFNEEDELRKHTDGKLFAKFKNPSLDNPAILKAAQGSIIVKKGRTDANEGDNPHNSSNSGTAQSSLEIVREDFAAQYTTAGPGATWKSRSPSHQNVPCPKTDTFESKSSFTEVEARFSRHEAPSPGESQSSCALLSFPLNSEPVNLKSDADGSDESSPSSSISNIAENEGIVDGLSSDSFFSASEMALKSLVILRMESKKTFTLTGELMISFAPSLSNFEGLERSLLSFSFYQKMLLKMLTPMGLSF